MSFRPRRRALRRPFVVSKLNFVSMLARRHTAYVNRFNLLFPLPRQPTYASSSPEIISLTPPVPTIYVAGNHDLGLHLPSSSLASYGRERFTESFGPTMGEKQWGGWDVTWVDSMALLEEGKVGEEAREWIERVGRSELR